jgi:hypothetical protein
MSVDPLLADAVRRALESAPKWLDFVVISGRRTAEQQHALWQKGRDADGGIVNLSEVVTYKDGIDQMSRHQFGNAVDIVAYEKGGITWGSRENFIRAAYVAGFAAARGVRLTGGFKWGWDPGHLELEV